MKPIRRQVSEILGVLIPENKWKEVFKELNGAGRITQKEITEIVIVILKRLEEMEDEK
jgi:hypothetical protein